MYPHQAKPPPHVWTVWRASLRAAFLKQSANNKAALNTPFIFDTNQISMAPWRSKLTKGMRLEDAIDQLPGYIKEVIGNMIYLQDNGQLLSEDLQKGATASFTDGTVKQSIGAQTYNICMARDKDDTCILGAADTPGDSATMALLHTEHFGVYVTIILLDIITVVHGHNMTSTHVHYADSQSVIDRLTKYEYLTDTQHDATDYDIWKEMETALQQAQFINFELKHVKGHQRESLHDDNGKQGPLTREAMYNDWCDNAVANEREDHQLPVQHCAILAVVVYLSTPQTLVTTSTYPVVYGLKTIPAAEMYVKRKLTITGTIFRSINWEAVGTYVKLLAISQQVKVMKYIYDWQNVGLQKEQQHWTDEEEYMCPYGCGQKEVPMHYLTCIKACNKMSRMCLEAINCWMIMVRTNNSIRVHFMNLFLCTITNDTACTKY